MTAVQLANVNAEIHRNLDALSDDENMLNRIAKYLRRLVREKEDPTLMSKEEFFANIDEAKNEIANGKGKTFDNVEELDRYIRSL
jgi:hypothetical protein